MRIDLALIGFGNVGRRFVRLLEEQRPRLLADYDLDCRLTGKSPETSNPAAS